MFSSEYEAILDLFYLSTCVGCCVTCFGHTYFLVFDLVAPLLSFGFILSNRFQKVIWKGARHFAKFSYCFGWSNFVVKLSSQKFVQSCNNPCLRTNGTPSGTSCLEQLRQFTLTFMSGLVCCGGLKTTLSARPLAMSSHFWRYLKLIVFDYQTILLKCAPQKNI